MKKRNTAWGRLSASLALGLLLAIGTSSQDRDRIDPRDVAYLRDSPQVRPGKFDEYGNIRFNDEKARLDNFAVELQNDPQANGYVIGYGGSICRVAEAKARVSRAMRYLVNERGISRERIVTVDGGYRQQLTVELYVLPAGATPPRSTPTRSRCLRRRPGGRE